MYIFRIDDDESFPCLLREVLQEKGWVVFDSLIHKENQWNLWWKISGFQISSYHFLHSWQRINHFPKSAGITRKDNLARLLKLQQSRYGSSYSFVPETFVLPNEYRKFVLKFTNSSKEKIRDDNIWICKPVDLSRGRGIVIIRKLSELSYDNHCVVQRYISKPYLINGYKCDLRLYVAVVSYHPLVLYLYNDGLVRFSCEKYDLSSLNNEFSHLTNTSINKRSLSYAVNKVGIGQGCKWTIKQLCHYFHQRHVCDTELWWNIIAIVNLTIMPQAPEIPQAKNCFELYGFDILIDENLKPWLLEVNFSPSLSYDCPTDSVKIRMLSDLIELLNFKPEDVRAAPHTTQPYATHQMDLSLHRTSVLEKVRPQSCPPMNFPRLFGNDGFCDERLCIDGAEQEKHEPDLHRTADEYPQNSTPSATEASSVKTRSKEKSHLRSQINQRQHQKIRQNIISAKKNSEGKRAHCRPVVGGFHRIYPLTSVPKHSSPNQMIADITQYIRCQLSPREQCEQLPSTKRNLYNIVSPFHGHVQPS